MKIRHEWQRWVRRIIIIVLLLMAAYPASNGPAYYAVGRGWLSYYGGYGVIYAPLIAMAETAPESPLVRLHGRYLLWWNDVGWRHSGRPQFEANSDDNPLPPNQITLDIKPNVALR